MSASATVIDELRELHDEAIRDLGAIVERQATDMRRLAIRAGMAGRVLDAVYAFGAAAALTQVAEVFKNR